MSSYLLVKEPLYAKLSPSEQAALVIEAAARLDESAIGAIIE
ncbi:hypothetical protein [Methylicorpusculum sp.]|nr:hypothetical protein [Methylicorpusculum sp.]